MALKDSFINLNKALRTTLQNVPAVVDTLIRGFDEIGDAAEEQTTYSTAERVVGKWIDGSDIYEKVVEFESELEISYTGFTNTTVDSTNMGNVISVIGIHSDGTSFGTFLADPTRSSHTVLGLSTTRNGNVSAIKTIIIRYTKSAPSRSPENDTKNVIDDEPVEEPAEDLKK